VQALQVRREAQLFALMSLWLQLFLCGLVLLCLFFAVIAVCSRLDLVVRERPYEGVNWARAVAIGVWTGIALAVIAEVVFYK